MDDKLFKLLDDLDIKSTNNLLDKDIDLSIDYATKKRIEKSVMMKTGYYNNENKFLQMINNILGGIIMKKRIALALSVGAVLSLGGGTYAYAKTPVAYVSLDINPSVELGVNAFDKVVSVEAYNEDGQKVLEGTDLVNTNVDTAVSTVVSNAISDGYIHNDGTSAVEITAVTDKDKVATELEDTIKTTVDQTLDDKNVKAQVETENVALAKRDEARKLGITPGKLNLIQKLQALDPSIKVEDYKSTSVKDIKKKTKELRENGKSNKNSTTTTDNATNKNSTTDINTEVVKDQKTEDKTLPQTPANIKKENNSAKNNKAKNTTIESKKQNTDDDDKDSDNDNNKQNENGKSKSKNK